VCPGPPRTRTSTASASMPAATATPSCSGPAGGSATPSWCGAAATSPSRPGWPPGKPAASYRRSFRVAAALQRHHPAGDDERSDPGRRRAPPASPSAGAVGGRTPASGGRLLVPEGSGPSSWRRSFAGLGLPCWRWSEQGGIRWVHAVPVGGGATGVSGQDGSHGTAGQATDRAASTLVVAALFRAPAATGADGSRPAFHPPQVQRGQNRRGVQPGCRCGCGRWPTRRRP
jgi:hypothetical protein